MSSVSRRTTKATLPALSLGVVLSLAGCAGLRPGVAAQVGDETITVGEVDQLALGLCAYFKASQQQEPESSENARRTALGLMIRSELARRFGQDLDLDIDANTADAAVRDLTPVVEELPREQRETFLDAVRASIVGDLYSLEGARALLTARGEKVTEEAIFNEQLVLYRTWAEEAGIEVDPRFGTWQDTDVAPGSGSLSLPAVQVDEAANEKPCP